MKLNNDSVAVGILAALLAISAGCSSNLTSKTSGEVVRVTIDKDRKTSTKRTSSNKRRRKTKTTIETEVDYRYQVDGTSYEGYSEKDGDVQSDYRSGSPVVVCFNPKDPAESDVFPAGSNCD